MRRCTLYKGGGGGRVQHTAPPPAGLPRWRKPAETTKLAARFTRVPIPLSGL